MSQDIISEEIMKKVRAFQLECIQSDVEFRQNGYDLGTIIGIELHLILRFTKPKLTAEEEAMIERRVEMERRKLGLE